MTSAAGHATGTGSGHSGPDAGSPHGSGVWHRYGRRPEEHMEQEYVEALVVLGTGNAAGSRLEEVRQHAVVLQWLPPRIAIVLVPAGLPLPPAGAGTGWYRGDVPAPVAAEFTPAERLFVDAWLSRREAKTRPGEGLPWDAAGRQAPDWPEEPPHLP